MYARYPIIHGSNEHESHIFTMRMYVSTYDVSFGFSRFFDTRRCTQSTEILINAFKEIERKLMNEEVTLEMFNFVINCRFT